VKLPFAGQDAWFPDVHSTGMAAVVLSLCLYPYVYLLARSALLEQAPATYDAAFMEAFMDWRLVYRTPAEVRALATGIDEAQISHIDQFCDENDHVAYMRVVKR